IINKISRAVQVVLLAPIKLPGKALNILKYVAVGLGIIESVLETEDQKSEMRDQASEDQKDKSNKVVVDYIDTGGEEEDGTERKEEKDAT
ncbi:hypothetical protein, partial [Sphingobacterium pedocola]